MWTWSMDWECMCMWKLGDSWRLLLTTEFELWRHRWEKLLKPFCWDERWKNRKKASVLCLLLGRKYCGQSWPFDASRDCGENPLPLCRNCFDMSITFPATRWCGNPKQNRDKSKVAKKRQLDKRFASRKRKCIKRSWIVFWGIYHTHFLKVLVKYSLHVIVI